MLPPSELSNKIVLSGAANGSARLIQDDYHPPALLLYIAALNVIGSAPQTELREIIVKGISKLKNFGLDGDEDIKMIIQATLS